MYDDPFDVKPADIDRELRRAGIDPSRAVTRRTVDPSRISLSEWNRLGVDRDRAREYADNWSDQVPRVLLAKGNGGYVVIDGAHRTEAAQMIGEDVPALVVSNRVKREIENFGDTAMYEWAHSK